MADTISNDDASKLIEGGLAKIKEGQADVTRGFAALMATLPKPDEPPKPDPEPPTTPEEPKPPVTPPVATVKVKTIAALLTALKAAKDGAVIELAAGKFGGLKFTGVVVSGRVTVLGAGATLTGFQLIRCSGMSFRGFDLDLAGGGIAKLDACQGIDLIGMSSSNATLYGFSLVNSQDILVDGCKADIVKDGLHANNCDRVKVTGLEVSGATSDGATLAACVDVLFKGCLFRDWREKAGAHRDAIQFITTGTTRPSRNVVITENKVMRGKGSVPQGFFLTDQLGTMPYDNITITKNELEGAMFNAIAVSNGSNVTVEDNVVQPYAGQDSRIQITAVRGGRVRGNESAVYVKDSTGVDVAGNLALAEIAPR